MTRMTTTEREYTVESTVSHILRAATAAAPTLSIPPAMWTAAMLVPSSFVQAAAEHTSAPKLRLHRQKGLICLRKLGPAAKAIATEQQRPQRSAMPTGIVARDQQNERRKRT